MKPSVEKKKLRGPWRSIHAAIWLIGLGILAWKDWWWPGILFLLAISAILEAILMQVVPQAFEQTEKQGASPSPTPPPTSPPSPAQTISQPPAPTAQTPEHRVDLLPSTCPRCGGPIRGHEVKWTSVLSADCPYCGMNLPMKKT